MRPNLHRRRPPGHVWLGPLTEGGRGFHPLLLFLPQPTTPMHIPTAAKGAHGVPGMRPDGLEHEARAGMIGGSGGARTRGPHPQAKPPENVSGSPSFRPSSWAQVRRLAETTPADRNRYVDFLRAVSICVVVVGHWLMAAPTVETGLAFTLSDLLQVQPWTQWLTWVFQVMPIFFVVGGYANAVSWESAQARGDGYDQWVSQRLQRLVRPVIPFILAWCAFAFVARWAGLGRRIVDTGSVAAFVPTWFLAAYVVLVLLAPAMYRLWRSFGMTSFWTLVAGAAVVDVVARMPGLPWLSWVNYVFVWLAIHQLGFAWRDGAFTEGRRALSFALGGFAALVVLKGLAGYPTSMVTVPGDTAANSNPPTLALLALGVMQSGFLLALQSRVRPWLERPTPWSLTVFVNGIIMTVYLWHATVMVFLVGLLEWPGGIGLHLDPGTVVWWATRIPWILALSVLLAGVLAKRSVCL